MPSAHQRGPEFTLSADAAEHPILLAFRDAEQMRICRLAVMAQRFCRAGILHLYDDEIAGKRMSLDQWDALRDKLLKRKVLFETRTAQGSRQYEFAFWLVPYWGDEDKRQAQDWESVAVPSEMALKDKQGNAKRKYVDDAEKQAYWRECQKAERERREPLTLDAFRRQRTDYDTPQENADAPKDTQLFACVTDKAAENISENRNGNAPDMSLSTEVVVLSSYEYKKQLLTISELCLLRYGEKPTPDVLNRNTGDILRMMELIGLYPKTIQEFQDDPTVGLAVCVRQMIYLPYNKAKKEADFLKNACKLDYKVPPDFQKEMSRRREAAAREAQQRETVEREQRERDDAVGIRLRLDTEEVSLSVPEAEQMEAQARLQAGAKHAMFRDRIRAGNTDPATLNLVNAERDLLLAERIEARSRAQGVEYAPPPPAPAPIVEETAHAAAKAPADAC